MAFYIDFNHVDIHDYLDLSEIDTSYEKYLQSLSKLSAQIEEVVNKSSEEHFEKAAGDIFTVLAATESEKPLAVKAEMKAEVKAEMKAEVKAETTPVKAAVVSQTPKPSAEPQNKQQMYIDYITGKYDKNLADFFVNIVQNPFQTFIRTQFEVRDTFKQDLTRKILKTDENSVEQDEQKKHQITENFRKRAAERLSSQTKTDELNRMLESKRRINDKRV